VGPLHKRVGGGRRGGEVGVPLSEGRLAREGEAAVPIWELVAEWCILLILHLLFSSSLASLLPNYFVFLCEFLKVNQ
jgi:hypothetical protein